MVVQPTCRSATIAGLTGDAAKFPHNAPEGKDFAAIA